MAGMTRLAALLLLLAGVAMLGATAADAAVVVGKISRIVGDGLVGPLLLIQQADRRADVSAILGKDGAGEEHGNEPSAKSVLEQIPPRDKGKRGAVLQRGTRTYGWGSPSARIRRSISGYTVFSARSYSPSQ